MKNNAEEANRVYTAEQARLEGKRKEAAFEAQSILAKSIGTKGTILASGRTGQSIGLLVNDVERQAGIQKAQQTAMLESDRVASIIGMETPSLRIRLLMIKLSVVLDSTQRCLISQDAPGSYLRGLRDS